MGIMYIDFTNKLLTYYVCLDVGYPGLLIITTDTKTEYLLMATRTTVYTTTVVDPTRGSVFRIR